MDFSNILWLSILITVMGLVGDFLGIIDIGLNLKEKYDAFREKRRLNKPFDKKEEIIDVLIVPFRNWGSSTEMNIAQGIYEKMVEFSKKNDNLFNFRYYHILEGDKKHNNKENVEKIGEKLIADMVIWGEYELKQGSPSNAHIKNISLDFDSSTLKEEQKIAFSNILDGLEDGVLTKDSELNLLFRFEYFRKMADFNRFSDLALWLFREAYRNNLLNESIVISDINMETISIHKTLRNREIIESEDYGLTEHTPMYGTPHQIIHRTYVEKLTYNGENIKIGKIDSLFVDFYPRRMLENGFETWVNSYQILDLKGNEIDTIYVFEKSDYEYLRPPKGFDFPYEIPKKRGR